MSNHAIALRIRDDIAAIGARAGALLRIVEVPPDPPPVMATVAEVYERPDQPYAELIAAAQSSATASPSRRASSRPTLPPRPTSRSSSSAWTRKGRLNGISTENIVGTLCLALAGMPAGIVHPREQNELPIVLRLPREETLRPRAPENPSGSRAA